MNLGGALRIFIGSLAFVLNGMARAESFYVPTLCAPETAHLKIQNISPEPQAFWVQLKNPAQEFRYELAPQTDLQIAATEFLKSSQAFSLRTWTDQHLRFTWDCAGKPYALGSSISPFVNYALKTTDSLFTLQLMNISPLVNHVQISFFDAQDMILRQENISLQNYYETQNFSFNRPLSATRLELRAEGRLHTWLLDGQQELRPPLASPPALLKSPASLRYFLVSTKQQAEASFVIGIDNERMIAQAREQIDNSQLEKIIVARISVGNGNHNRSFYEKDHSPYSWSVTAVDSFADFALNDCDGNPDEVEDQLSERMASGGRICFWRYRVIRELTLTEVQRGY